MTDVADASPPATSRSSRSALHDWIVAQRWFASKTARGRVASNVLEAVSLRDERADARAVRWSRRASRPGRTRLYQVPLGLRPADEGWSERVIFEVEGWTVYDALADPAARPRAAAPDARQQRVPGRPRTSSSSAGRQSAGAGLGGTVDVRPVGVEQSNSSIVFGEELIMKAFRRSSRA